jgi:hypothetical protein
LRPRFLPMLLSLERVEESTPANSAAVDNIPFDCQTRSRGPVAEEIVRRARALPARADGAKSYRYSFSRKSFALPWEWRAVNSSRRQGTLRAPFSISQRPVSRGSPVMHPKRRTGSMLRSGLMATQFSPSPASIPAAFRFTISSVLQSTFFGTNPFFASRLLSAHDSPIQSGMADSARFRFVNKKLSNGVRPAAKRRWTAAPCQESDEYRGHAQVRASERLR